jgi:hypothetical protein
MRGDHRGDPPHFSHLGRPRRLLQPRSTALRRSDWAWNPGAAARYFAVVRQGRNGVPQPYEFASILKFIETRFGIPPLTPRDQNANDLTDAFDFGQTPLQPLVLQERICPVMASTNSFGPYPIDSSSPERASAFSTTARFL